MKGAILIAIGAIILIAFSCSNEGDGFFARLLKGGSAGIAVTVESVSVQERAKEMSVPAQIEAAEAVEVTAPEDVVVERVLVAEGDRVSAGDPLVRLSEADLTARLSRLRADLKEAQALLDKNTYFFKNRDRLLAEGRIDQTQYDNLESEVAKDEAAIEKIRQDIAKAEERPPAPVIASPIAGIVAKIAIAPGLTAPAGKPIMAVAKSDQLTVAFRLPQEDAGLVRAGQTVRLAFPEIGGESVAARVMGQGTEVDPRDNTVSFAAAIANPGGRYRAGMRAEVLLPTADRQRLFIVPEEALIRERGAVFVYTVDKRVAHKVQVLPSESVGNRVEILRGLKEGDVVVVRGHDKLAEGTKVDISRP